MQTGLGGGGGEGGGGVQHMWERFKRLKSAGGNVDPN